MGSYNDTYGLKMQTSFQAGWHSLCSSCNVCVLPVGDTSAYSATSNALAAPSLVAFGSVHVESTLGRYQCGSVDLSGFQSALAFFYSVSVASNLTDIGAVYSDTCGNAGRTFANIYTQLSSPRGANGQPRALLYAVSGPEDAAAAASLLCPVGIPLLAGQLTASTITSSISSSKGGGDIFACSSSTCLLSTLPDFDTEASAIVAVLRKMQWLYVGVITTSDSNGQAALSAFQTAAANTTAGANYICVIGVGTVTASSPAEAAAAWQVMTAVPDLSVVVVLASTGALNIVLSSFATQALNSRYILVGGRNWGVSMGVVSGIQQSLIGSIIVAPPTAIPIGYQAWLHQLTPVNHAPIADDWFEDVWQTVHQCQMTNATRVQTQYQRICSETELSLENYLNAGPYFIYDIASTFAGARALQTAISIQCATASTTSARHACINSLNYSQLQTLLETSTWSLPDGELSSNIKFSLNSFRATFTVQTFQRNSSNGFQYFQVSIYLNNADFIPLMTQFCNVKCSQT